MRGFHARITFAARGEGRLAVRAAGTPPAVPQPGARPLSKHTPVAVTLGTALAGLALGGSAFAMEPLAQGYMLAAGEAAKAAEGKCGEGKCGGMA